MNTNTKRPQRTVVAPVSNHSSCFINLYSSTTSLGFIDTKSLLGVVHMSIVVDIQRYVDNFSSMASFLRTDIIITIY